MEKKHVLAAFSMGEVVFRTRGLNDNEKKMLADAFNSLVSAEEFETTTYITALHGGLFNHIMQ